MPAFGTSRVLRHTSSQALSYNMNKAKRAMLKKYTLSSTPVIKPPQRDGQTKTIPEDIR